MSREKGEISSDEMRGTTTTCSGAPADPLYPRCPVLTTPKTPGKLEKHSDVTKLYI